MDPAEEEPMDGVPKEYEECMEQADDEVTKPVAQKHEYRRYTRVKGMGNIIHRFEPKRLKWFDEGDAEKKCQMLELLLTDEQAAQFFLTCHPIGPVNVFWNLTAVEVEHHSSWDNDTCGYCNTYPKKVDLYRD